MKRRFAILFSFLSYIIYPGHKIETLLESMARYRLVMVAFVQGILIVLANFLAFYIRFEGNIPANYYHLFVYTLPMLLALRFIFFYLFGLFQGLWRFISIKDMKSIFFAITLASVSFFILLRGGLGITSYPISIYIIDWLLSIMLLGGIRFARRIHNDLKSEDRDSIRRVLVVGAGDAAEKVLREIVNIPDFHYNVVGLIDDTPGKQGLRIHNVPVLGTINDLGEIISRKSPDEILVAIPSAPLSILRQITKECKRFGKPIKVIPGLREMLFGKNLPILTRNIEPEDLLLREHVKIEISSLRHFFQGKRVMITGAGGTIGSEISGQIAKCKPACLILFERHEASLYNIEKGLGGSHSEFPIYPIIGDVTDAQRVAEVMAETRPQILFHAAANKHVPMMEFNPSEAIKTNILGTKIVAEAAGRSNVEVFVLVSTDKAVDSVNIMGASKRVAELTMQGLNGSSKTRFVTVRFGNVLASSGSVIPLFKEQIKKGGPLTVTHPDVIRYFMTTTEAVYLLLQAATICKGGEVFVLDMGKPIKVLDVAKMLIQLYGFTPAKDIDITFTGLRPGERLFEMLFNKNEKVETTAYPKILMAVNGVPGNARHDGINKAIGSIKEAISKGNLDEALMVVKALVPSYMPKVCKRPTGEIEEVKLAN